MVAVPSSIRPATADDADAIAAVYAAYVTGSLATFEEVAPTGPAMALRMEQDPRLPWLVAEREGLVVGYAYASPHRARPGYRWSAEVSVYLSAAESGRGTGRALYDRLMPVVTELGYVNAYAGIALPNDASVALHEAVGFRPVGVFRGVGFKLGRWVDVGWWHLALGEPPPESPAEPRAWSP